LDGPVLVPEGSGSVLVAAVSSGMGEPADVVVQLVRARAADSVAARENQRVGVTE
jgi:hypothetical protein